LTGLIVLVLIIEIRLKKIF